MIVTRELRPPRVQLGDVEIDLNPRVVKTITRSATEALHTAPPTSAGVKQAHDILAAVEGLVEPLESAALTFLAAAGALRGEPSDAGDALTETCREITAYGLALQAVEPDLDLDTTELQAALEAVADDYAKAATAVKSRALKLDIQCKSLTARAIVRANDEDALNLHACYEVPDELGAIEVPPERHEFVKTSDGRIARGENGEYLKRALTDPAGFLRSQVKLGLLRVEDTRRAKRDKKRAAETRDMRLRIREIWNG